MVHEKGFLLLAAAKLVAADARRHGQSLDEMMTQTVRCYQRLQQEIDKAGA